MLRRHCFSSSSHPVHQPSGGNHSRTDSQDAVHRATGQPLASHHVDQGLYALVFVGTPTRILHAGCLNHNWQLYPLRDLSLCCLYIFSIMYILA